MASKEDFSATEWESVVDAPAIAGLTVVAAQRGGTVRESIAMAKAYAEAAKEHGSSGLLGSIVSSRPDIAPREFSSVEDLNTQGVERIRSAVSTLEAKGASPEEVEAYKQFTISVAQRAAEADKSGGVLGIGGERVSEAERAALDRIREALGVAAEPSTS
jgi:hypothetical protein